MECLTNCEVKPNGDVWGHEVIRPDLRLEGLGGVGINECFKAGQMGVLLEVAYDLVPIQTPGPVGRQLGKLRG